MNKDSFVMTRHEVDSLYGVGPLAFAVYVHLRLWMDEQTGVTGESRPVSYRLIEEACERHIARNRGEQIEKPGRKELRIAIEALERAEVVRKLPGELKLVFELPLARCGGGQ